MPRPPASLIPATWPRIVPWLAVAVLGGCETSDECECPSTDRCLGMACAPSDQCHMAYCNSATGECMNEAKVDGFHCDDGDVCTQTDTCQAGVCTGGDPVACTADQCHVPGTCDPATGLCPAPTEKADGTPCDDQDLCTRTDACQAGICTGRDPVVCTADQCYVPGTCEPTTGECSAPDMKPDGTACDNEQLGTDVDVCLSGRCVGKLVVCTPEHGITLCNGICVATERDREHCGGCGTRCSDGELCENGSCVLSCQEGHIDCGGRCIDPGGACLACP